MGCLTPCGAKEAADESSYRVKRICMKWDIGFAVGFWIIFCILCVLCILRSSLLCRVYFLNMFISCAQAVAEFRSVPGISRGQQHGRKSQMITEIRCRIRLRAGADDLFCLPELNKSSRKLLRAARKLAPLSWLGKRK